MQPKNFQLLNSATNSMGSARKVSLMSGNSVNRMLKMMTMAFALTTAHQVQGIVTDGSFELPALAAGSYVYNPGGGAWTFLGNSGISNPPNAFNSPPAPDGVQVAFMQSNLADPTTFGSFSQPITLPAVSGNNYTIEYLHAGRSLGQFITGNVAYDILLDLTLVASDFTLTGQPYTPVSHTFNFPPGAGSYTLTFRMNPLQPFGDDTAFFDSIHIVPEPSSVGIAFFGLVGLLVRRFR